MQNCNLKSMIYLLIVVLVPLMSVGCGPTEEEYMAKIDEVNRYKRLSKQRQTEAVEKEKEIEKMGDSLKSLNEELFKVQTEKKRAVAQQQTNKEHLDSAINQLQNVESQLETAKGRSEKLEGQLGNIYEELGKTEDQLKETKSQFESTEGQLKSTRSLLVRTKTQLERTKTQLGGTKAQLERTKTQLGGTKAQLERTKAQLRKTESQLKRAEEQLGMTKTQLEKSSILNKKLEENVRDYYLKITNLEQKERELQGKYEELKEHERKLNSQIDSYNAQLSKEQTVEKNIGQKQQELLNSLREQLESDKIKITELSNRIAVRLDEQLLFDSGEAFIKASGFKVLKRIGTVLKKINDKHIQVEGHTDNRPIRGRLKRKFATNWELSVARATSVTRYLVDEIKIVPNRISSTGFGEFQPVAENDTPEGRQANRRVEFALLPLRSNEDD